MSRSGIQSREKFVNRWLDHLPHRTIPTVVWQRGRLYHEEPGCVKSENGHSWRPIGEPSWSEAA
jgi:hypothetical protein